MPRNCSCQDIANRAWHLHLHAILLLLACPARHLDVAPIFTLLIDSKECHLYMKHSFLDKEADVPYRVSPLYLKKHLISLKRLSPRTDQRGPSIPTGALMFLY